jgi:hypothetical protein
MRISARSKQSRLRSRRGGGGKGIRFATLPVGASAPEALLHDLRRIGSRLRTEARQVLREYLGGLSRMGLDTVESATYLSCAFLNALLEEAPSVRAELAHQLERFIGRSGLSVTERFEGRERPSSLRRSRRSSPRPRRRAR